MIRDAIGKLHYFATFLLFIGLVPAFHVAHIPFRFAWGSYFLTYWWSLAFQSMVVAIVLYAIGFSSECWKKLTSRIGTRVNPGKAFFSLFIPAAYFFLMFILVFSYNDVIATIRFNGSGDLVLNRMDSWILGGLTVASVASRATVGAKHVMELIYYLMFSVVGGCFILLALRCVAG